jgi:exodeoxyribonuclease VII small subunit
MTKEIKYEEAMRQLESIVTKMENGDLDLDEMGEQLKKAQQLVKLLKAKLTKTDQEIRKIFEEDEK